MIARVALLAAVLLLAAPGGADAHWDLAADGHPKITTGWLGAEGVALSVCPPGGAPCTPVAWTNREYLPGETAPGTTFAVRLPDGRTERSTAWTGQVRSTGLPTITGRLYATGDAQSVAGMWTGGWGDDRSWTHLAACLTPAGTSCVLLPQISGCPVPCRVVAHPTAVSLGGLAGIPEVLAGRYLFAVERRVPRDQRGWPIPVPALWGMGFSHDLEAPSALVAVSKPVGPLASPESGPESGPAPGPEAKAPAATLRVRALRARGRLYLGRIECAQPCRVSLKVSGGGRKAYRTTFRAHGVKAITAPVRRGRLTVRVHADGKLLALGRVRGR